MIGKSILTWMVEQDRTVGYLAREAGLDTGILIDAITSETKPGADELSALARVMAVSESELCDAANETFSPRRDPDPLRCFTVKDVAALMQVSEDTVRAEIESGALGSITIGQRVKRVPRSALEERLSRWEHPG